MSLVESAQTQTVFLVGTAASLATSFVLCLDFALPPCSSVVTSVWPWIMFVMGRLTVEMGQMRNIARVKVDHGCARETFSQDHSHVFRVREIRKISDYKETRWAELGQAQFNLGIDFTLMTLL